MKILIALMLMLACCFGQTCKNERVASSSRSEERAESNSSANAQGKEPMSGEDHYYRANNLKQALEADEALKEYHLAIENGYDTVELRIELGTLLAGQLKRYEEAVEELRIAARREEGNWRAHWPLSQALLATKQYDEALTEIEASDRLDPEGHADGFYTFYRAKAFDGLERYREALEEYEAFLKHYVEISPGDPDVIEARERIKAIREILNRN